MSHAFTGSFLYTHEDEALGQSLDFELAFYGHPGEPMVMYYPDGSGYPGSDPEVEFIAARCVEITDEHRTWKPADAEGRSMGQWFLEQIETGDNLRARLEELASKDAADHEEAAYEAYCDPRDD